MGALEKIRAKLHSVISRNQILDDLLGPIGNSIDLFNIDANTLRDALNVESSNPAMMDAYAADYGLVRHYNDTDRIMAIRIMNAIQTHQQRGTQAGLENEGREIALATPYNQPMRFVLGVSAIGTGWALGGVGSEWIQYWIDTPEAEADLEAMLLAVIPLHVRQGIDSIAAYGASDGFVSINGAPLLSALPGHNYYPFVVDSDNITIADHANFNWGILDWSYEGYLWLKQPSGAYDRMRIIEKWSGGGYLFKIQDDKTIEVAHQGGSIFTGITALDLEWETWFHIIISLDRDSNLICFIDAVLQGTEDISGDAGVDISSGDDLQLGKAAGGVSQSFTGKRALERFWNRALIQADATALHNGGAPLDYIIPDADKWAAMTNLWDAAASVFTSGTYAWSANGTNTIANVGNTLEVTYVNHADGAWTLLQDAKDLATDLTVGAYYVLVFDAKYTGGASGSRGEIETLAGKTYTPAFTTGLLTYMMPFTCDTADGTVFRYDSLGAGNVLTVDNIKLYRVGCVAQLLAENITAPTWPDSSINGHDGVVSGPVADFNYTVINNGFYNDKDTMVPRKPTATYELGNIDLGSTVANYQWLVDWVDYAAWDVDFDLLMEVRFSSDKATWNAWTPYQRNQWVQGSQLERYAQFRITLTMNTYRSLRHYVFRSFILKGLTTAQQRYGEAEKAITILPTVGN